MKNIFVIPGYGIPKDILKDEQQKRYLGLVFNYIFQFCLDNKETRPLIIFCGGNTDIFKPYKRTEAKELKKLFLTLAKRSFVKNYTKNWQYKLREKSLSTLENILEANKIIKKIKGKKSIYFFTEKTLEFKVKRLAREILKTNFKVIALDFDLSINRYRNPDFINKKESLDIKLALKSLRDRKFFNRYRELLKEKIEYLRKAKAKHHQEAIYKWWQSKIKELEKIK
ncbi:MAG: hypothetical protein ACK413_01280 [Patescibacteria group bacterium]